MGILKPKLLDGKTWAGLPMKVVGLYIEIAIPLLYWFHANFIRG